MKQIISIILILLLSSCSSKDSTPKGVLSKQEMKSVLWDVLSAQFMAQQNIRRDTTLNINAETKALAEKVFLIHKITSKDFDKSYNWYTSHPDIMKEMMDSLYNQKQREFNPPLSEDDKIEKRDRSRIIKPLIHE